MVSLQMKDVDSVKIERDYIFLDTGSPHHVQLVEDLKNSVPQTALSTIALEQLTGEFDLIINATTASLTGDALQLPESLVFHHAYEMAYGKPSHFLDQAKLRDIPTSEGFGMLVGQAIESFYIWNGIRPELKDFI